MAAKAASGDALLVPMDGRPIRAHSMQVVLALDVLKSAH